MASVEPQVSLHVQLLGGFVLTADVAVRSSVHWPRAQSLLAYLILHRRTPVSRRQLAFTFWPDSTETQARTNLRRLLHELNRALPGADRFLIVDSQAIWWRPDAPFTLDVADFEAASTGATRDGFERAVELYQGDLLPGCYDDWIAPERDRLRAMFVAALERLVVLAEQDRDYPAALAFAKRLLQADRYCESAYRSLMRLHALTGDRAAALNVYHTCVTVLRRELGVPPDPVTRRLHEQLLSAGAAAVPANTTSVVPLFGRSRELEQLQSAWRSAAMGHPGMLLITGEPGIGKTRLTEELLAWAERQDVVTAVAQAHPAEGRLPFAPVAALLRAPGLPALEPVWLTEIARVLPEVLAKYPGLPAPQPLREAWQRARLFEALARAIDCGSRPRLLVIDDIQWCDPDTLAWLQYLMRLDSAARLLIVGTASPGEAETRDFQMMVSSFRRARLLEEMSLGPLDSHETGLLAEHLAGERVEPDVLAGLYAASEGNPLFVVEMVQAIRTRGRSLRDGHLPPTHPPFPAALADPLPRRVQQVLDGRLAQLSPPARRMAALAAMIGRQFSFRTLQAASRIADDELVNAFDELWQRRIVREAGSGLGGYYEFSHDKIREAAGSNVSPARRAHLHRRVAEALAATGDGDDGQIGYHYEQAGIPGEAVASYRRAAESAAAVYANAEAAAFYRRALALLGGLRPPLQQDPETVITVSELQARLDNALFAMGQYREATAVYREVAGGTINHTSMHASSVERPAVTPSPPVRQGPAHHAALWRKRRYPRAERRP